MQLQRALGDTFFQCRGKGAQRTFHPFVVGHVRIGGDEAAVGERIAANLNHGAVRQRAFVRVGMGRAQVIDTPLYQRLGFSRAEHAAVRVVADQIGNRPAGADVPGRVAEQVDVGAVPGHQAQVAIHHADPGTEMVERGLQQFAIERGHPRGLLDELQRLAGGGRRGGRRHQRRR